MVYMVAVQFDHVWRWENRPIGQYRYGQRCQVVARSTRLNSIWVRFPDGYEVNTSAWAVRPLGQHEGQQLSFFEENDNG